MSFNWWRTNLLRAVGICLVGFAVAAKAQMSQDASAFVRELDEWREVCAFWVVEVARVYPADSAERNQVKAQYIVCASRANALIGQIQFDTLGKAKMARKRYEPHVKKATSASEALAETGKKLLLEARSQSRGKSRGEEDYTKLVAERAKDTVTIAGGLLDMLDKHKKMFQEADTQRRQAINKLLDERKWKPVEDLVKQAEPPGRNP